MAVNYEWDVESVCDSDNHPDYGKDDIIDHNHFDTYAEAVQFATTGTPDEDERYDLVLVCDDDNGRSWAYMKDGKLPEYFEDAYQNAKRRVPQRFHKEVARL